MYLRLHSAGKDCPRAMQRGDNGSGTKPVCLHTCTGGTALLLGNVPQWEGRELLSAGRTGRRFTVQLVAPEQLQSFRNLAQALQTVQVPDPDEGLDPVTQSLAWGTLATAMQYLPLFLWRAKNWLRMGEVLVLTSCYDLSPHFAILHSADSGIQDC